MKHKVNLTEGSVTGTLVKLAMPMMIGMVGMVIFNLVDTYFIGRLGAAELAAMSFTLPVVFLQGSISMGLGVGAAAVISRAIGKSDHEMVKRLTTDSIFLSVTIVLVMVTIGMLTIDPLFRSLGAKDNILVMVKEYMSIWYIGVPFVVIPMVGNNAIRAAGNTFIPSMIMLTAITINVILDPLLIFGIGPFPVLRLRGAAIATVIARATTLIMSLSMLHFRFNMITLKTKTAAVLIGSWKKILYISIPAALTQMIVPLSMGIITRLVSEYGKAAVAAIGVGNRIEMVSLSPLMALGAVLIPFTGQNLGAGKIDRIEKGIKTCLVFAFLYGIFLIILFYTVGPYAAPLFNKDAAVISDIVLYLHIVSLGFGFQAMLFLNSQGFNALGKPFYAAGFNFLRMFCLYIPIALFASRYLGLGLKGILSGACISAILAGALSSAVILKKISKLNQ
ncbi:MATE family efflux transporter [Spirochaetota bacterium]